MSIFIHPSAVVDPNASLGEGTRIWHHAQVRENAQIGENCIIGKGVYIDIGVSIGDNVKIQNYVSVYHGVTLEEGVFIGPHVCFTNDLRPRAINSDGSPKGVDEWNLITTQIQHGASLGANSTIVCGITIGRWAMIGSGSVVTSDVPDFGLAFGNPARLHGFVCKCGVNLEKTAESTETALMKCPECGEMIQIPIKDWNKLLK